MHGQSREVFAYSWKIDYKALNAIISTPFIMMGFINTNLFVIGLCLFTIFYSSSQNKYYWLQINEDSLRFIKTKKNILGYKFDNSFASMLNAKEVALSEIESIQVRKFGNALEIKLKAGEVIVIDLISKPKKFRYEIFENIKGAVSKA